MKGLHIIFIAVAFFVLSLFDATAAENGDRDVAKKTVMEYVRDNVQVGGDSISFAIKTNLLYDVATALNLEVEIPIGDRWSVAVEDVFPWWSWGPHGNKYAFQMLEIGIEPRYWFLKKECADELEGHFAGIYAMSAKYDFQWDRDICYQGEYWSAGISYGYSLPVKEWFNLEFSVSVGYLRSDYRHYQPSPEYENLYLDQYNVGVLHYFGPTKVKVGMVIPIRIKALAGNKQ